MTSARIPEEDACHSVRNLCVFSRVQKGTQGLTHKDCVLQRVSLDALSDVMVVLEVRQSIDNKTQVPDFFPMHEFNPTIFNLAYCRRIALPAMKNRAVYSNTGLLWLL